MADGMVPRLVAKSPVQGLLPLTKGALTLSQVVPEAITCVAPLRGQTARVSEALTAQIGAPWPAPGTATGGPEARVIWSGLGQALVLGPRVEIPGAAVADLSDGWAVLGLEGALVADVLARLTPLDLRPNRFEPGQVARSLLGHMTCLFVKTGAARIEMLVFRSMARTAVQDLSVAMGSVADLEQRAQAARLR